MCRYEKCCASSTIEREVSAQHKKNADANNRAHDMNQKKNNTSLDTLAEEYEAFEVTMKKVAFDHEGWDV